MIYRMQLADSVDEMTFDLLEVPIEDKDIEGTADNTTIDGNVFTDYLWLKKQFVQKWSLMCEDDYTQLRGFYTRQWENAEVPTYKLFYGEDISSTDTATGNPISLTNDTDYPAPILNFEMRGNAEQTELPSEYQQLDYIENTNTTLMTYIDTSVELGASDFEISAGVNFTASTGGESPIISIWTGTYGYWNLFKTGNNIDCYTQAHHIITNGATNGTWFNFNLKRVGNDWTLADGVHANTTWVYATSTLINPTTLKINARGDLSTGYKTCAQYSYVKIIVAGELVRDYVPAKRISDGKIGFYDLVNNNFVASAGTNDFTAGNNAPNPDFPIEVKTVKGEQTLSINANEFNILLDSPTGANMIDMSDFEVGGLLNGNWSADMQRITNANHPIQCEPNTQYTLSAQLVPPVLGIRCGIHECSAGGTFIRDLGWGQLATTPFTFTTGSTTGSLKMVFSSSITSTTVTTGSTEDTTTFSSVDAFMRGCSFRLDEGATALESIELAKIGTYQDRIYKNDGKWYIEKQTTKQKIDNRGSIVLEVNGVRYNHVPYDLPVSAYPPLFSNYLMCANAYNEAVNSNNNTPNRIGLNGAGILLCNINGYTTTQEYIDFFNNHDVYIYYPLATPTTTEITNQNLIDQLEAIVNAYLPQGAVNISLTGTGAQGSMVLEYRLIVSKEFVIIPETPVRLTLTDGGVINPCGCRQNVQLTMRETIQ